MTASTALATTNYFPAAMGLFSQTFLPAPHADFSAQQTLYPRVQHFFSTGQALGFDQLAVLSKWSKDDWQALLDRRAASEALNSIGQLFVAWYGAHDAITLALAFSCWIATGCFVMQELTGNLSQVDRLWTFLPVIYSAHFTFWHHIQLHGFNSLVSSLKAFQVPVGVDPRMLLVLGLQCLWCIRLTRNAFYRGFFNFTEEDYRWPIVRRNTPRWLMPIFSLTFIAFIQNWLLLSTALPQVFLFTTGHLAPKIGWPDYALAGVTLTLLAVEQLADTQQQRYQNWKRSPEAAQKSFGDSKEAKAASAKLARGFVTEGLWGWTRHPNFTCEQLHWYSLYLFTLRVTMSEGVIGASQDAVSQFIESTPTVDWQAAAQFVKELSPFVANFALSAPLAMTTLFYSSTILTERISAGKYARYAAYQKRVSMFWPPLTTLKGFWLLVTGQLGAINEIVYGSGNAPKNSKKR